MNIDRDVRHADWLRVVARIRVLRRAHPNASVAQLRVIAEREQVAGVAPIEPAN